MLKIIFMNFNFCDLQISIHLEPWYNVSKKNIKNCNFPCNLDGNQLIKHVSSFQQHE